MTRPSTTAILLLTVLLTQGTAYAESDTLSTRFQQELDTRTLTVLGLQSMHSGESRMAAEAYGRVTERTLPLFKPQWKTDYRLNLNGIHSLDRGLDLLLTTRGEEFRDRQAESIIDLQGGEANLPDDQLLREPTIRAVTGQNSRISRGQLLLGARYRKNPGTEITLQAGGAFDRQEQGEGSGLSAQGQASWVDPASGLTSLNATGELNQYGERTYQENAIRARTTSEFGEASNHLTAAWSHRRHDLYLGLGSNVVSRIHDQISVDNQLATPLDYGFKGIYDFGFRRTRVDYSGGSLGQSLESNLTNRLALQGALAGWLGELAYHYNVEDREYSGDLVLGRRQILMLTANRRQPDGEVFRFHYSTQKLAFDSPDSLERSDRDRLIHRFSIQSVHPISETTDFTLEALALLDHLVYLEAQRSGDNRWNRVLRLKPGILWNPAPRWRQRATFEVLANYTAYDFDDFESGGDVRSNALRRWSASDTLYFPLARQFAGELSIRYDIEERGGLNWADFSQEVSDALEAVYFAAGLRRTLWDQLVFGAGYRYQRRAEDRATTGLTGESTRTRARTYVAQGPYFQIRTRSRSAFRLEIEATLLKVEDSDPNGRSRLDRISVAFIHNW